MGRDGAAAFGVLNLTSGPSIVPTHARLGTVEPAQLNGSGLLVEPGRRDTARNDLSGLQDHPEQQHQPADEEADRYRQREPAAAEAGLNSRQASPEAERGGAEPDDYPDRVSQGDPSERPGC